MRDIKTNRLYLLLVWGVFGLLAFTLVSVYAYFIYSERVRYESSLVEFRSQLMKQERERVEQEATLAAKFIEDIYLKAEQELKDSSTREVERALQQIQSIYQAFKYSLSPSELKSVITEALRPVRFFNGRGYIFIDQKDGTSILLPPRPEYEGRSYLADEQSNSYQVMMKILDVVNSVEKRGIIKYEWTMPSDPERTYTKISYIDQFEPFNWIIGAGDYIHSYRQGQDERLLQQIDQIRFGDNGYIAVVHEDGRLLKSAGARHLEGLHYSKMPAQESASIKNIIDKSRSGAGFVTYRWFYPDNPKLLEKTSFVRPLPYKGWILVAGIYSHKIDQLLTAEQARLDDGYLRGIERLGFSFMFLGLIAMLTAFLFTRWLSRRFKTYHQVINKRQSQLRDRTEKLKLNERIVESAREGILVTDQQAKIVHVNSAFTQITGYSYNDVIGERPSILSSGHHAEDFYHSMWQKLRRTGRWEGEVWNRRKDGTVYPQWLVINPDRDSQGKVQHFIATISDISQRKEDQAQLQYLSQFDTLTDLPNKRYLIEHMEQEVARVDRNLGQQLAVLYIDIDHFKKINDSMGHDQGDQFLVELGRRLKSCLRDTDVVGRITGDEFVVVLEPSESINTIVTQLSFRILEKVAVDLQLAGQQFALTCSIGIAIGLEDGDSAQKLLKNAHIALHHAKKKGRNNFQFFTQYMNEQAVKRMQLENMISAALKTDEFELYYQPQYAPEGRMLSVEALIRWPQADGSMITPDQFIPLAEETGQIAEIGNWVVKTACKQLAEWRLQGIELPVSVNVSAVQLKSDQFVEQLNRCLDKYRVASESLVIEITETAVIDNFEAMLEKLNQLIAIGVKLSLDDFGTGYSSLSLLKSMPVHELKIDRSFIDGLPDDPGDVSISSSLISVAHNLKLEVVAEGVETQEQLDILREWGCNKIQGYFFSPAVRGKEIVSLYVDSHSDKVNSSLNGFKP